MEKEKANLLTRSIVRILEPELAKLFEDNLKTKYTQDDYVQQFTIRVPENLAKLERIENIYRTQVDDTPPRLFLVLDKYKDRLEKLKNEKGEYVSPIDL